MDFHELLEIPQGDRRRYHDDVSVDSPTAIKDIDIVVSGDGDIVGAVGDRYLSQSFRGIFFKGSIFKLLIQGQLWLFKIESGGSTVGGEGNV
ncbi:hypothetical protein IEQ34_000281 [Dendrobium chrysotoxum]|uniref:Uncharacterized protein n=1 Tax=Dendrobium chrysotoxum TaxID=161865 RepID=A0AAV7HSG5_DENCH|nr:hypothetical protein IEQ34_000281 [Dendrobium chrysotoxum]